MLGTLIKILLVILLAMIVVTAFIFLAPIVFAFLLAFFSAIFG